MSERTPLLSGSVNGPSSTSLPSRRDVEQALPSKESRIKVAEASGALAAGKYPSQQQISKILHLLVESDTLKAGGGPQSRTARLGPEGARVLENVKGVLRAFKQWGEEKNGDDLLQNFFYNAASADVDIDLNGPSASAPSQRELSRDGQRAIASFRTIANLLVTNPSFRSLVSDFILLARDIFADAAATAADNAKEAAEKSRPSEKERQQGVDFNKLQQKGKDAANKAQRTSGKQVKDNLWDEVEGVRQYLDDKLPEGDEARDKIIQRLQKAVKESQENPEYRRAITALVNLVKKYAGKAQAAVEEVKDKSDISDEDEKVQQAGNDLKAFIEKLSGKSLDDLIQAILQAGNDVADNDKLSAYFKELGNYLDRILYDPGYVVSQSAYKKASTLIDDGQSLLQENQQWKKDAAELQKQFEELGRGIANDQATNQLVDSLESLGSAVEHAGKVGINALRAEGQGLYRDILDVIVPRIIGLVKEIPVPRIEFKSEEIDLVIDDINLQSVSFIPDSIRLVTHNDLRFTQGYATYASEYDASLRLRVEGFHFEAKDIAFWVNRKVGFWPFEDSGLLALQFGPHGISFDVTLENADEDDQETFFTVKKVDVNLQDFDFSVSKNKQWFATWFAKPILRAFVKRNLSSALETQIAEYLRQADFRLYGLQQRSIAATNAGPASASNFVRAVFSDSVFPQSSGGGVEVKQTGVVKYGRRGEYLLHVGIDEELFPNQPPADISNKQREKIRAKAKAASAQARRAVGAADQYAGAAKDTANKAKNEAKKEGEDLKYSAQEKKRREEKKEGWRSDAFDV